jgi:DNA-binding response OmpR family regulator
VAARSASERVLIVDDVDEMRTLFRRALSSHGYEVDVASTLAEARAMAPARYDAVLVDAHLGHERGIDLIAELVSADPAAARRCLVITGGAADRLPAGVAYLAKPFQPGQLIDAVRALHQPATGPGADRLADTRPDPGVRAPASARPDLSQPAAGAARAWQLLSLTRRLRAHDRREVVDFLHDGPIQELTAATLQLQMMSRKTSPRADSGLDAVLQQLAVAAASLRSVVDGHRQVLVPGTQLAVALQQRTAWLVAAPVTVDTDESPAGPGLAEIPVIVDIAELVLLGLLPAGPRALAHIAIRTGEEVIKIELTLTSGAGPGRPIGDPSAARESLDGLAGALAVGTHAEFCDQHWRAWVVLERPPPPQRGT